MFVAGGPDVRCGIARRGIEFFPRRSIACSLDPSVRFRLGTPALTLCRHVSWCLAMSSHALVSIYADPKSRLIVVQQRSTHAADALPQFTVKDFSWQAVGLHVVCMAEPSKASPNEQRWHAQRPGALQDLGVGDFVLRSDLQQAPKAVEVESIESPLLSDIGRLRLAAIKESRQDTCLVEAHLVPFAQQVIAPYRLLSLAAAALAILELLSASSEYELDTVDPK